MSDANSLYFASRRRLRELIRSVLGETVECDSDLDQEVNDFFQFLLKK